MEHQISKPLGSITTEFAVGVRGGRTFDLDTFSQIAGHKPTQVRHQKVPMLKDHPDYGQTEWSFKLEQRPHWSIDSAINEALDFFEDRREQITTFVAANGCYVHFWFRLHGDSTMIEYRLAEDTIKRLAAFGCSVSFAVDGVGQTSILPPKL